MVLQEPRVAWASRVAWAVLRVAPRPGQPVAVRPVAWGRPVAQVRQVFQAVRVALAVRVRPACLAVRVVRAAVAVR